MPKDVVIPPPQRNGEDCIVCGLADGLEIGRAVQGLVLDAPSISRRQARLARSADGGWLISDESESTNSLINGQVFNQHRLIIGDRWRCGPYQFRFDGRSLVWQKEELRPVVEVFGVTKQFRQSAILKGVSLQVASGRLVGLLGASGAGKSTLLDILCGLQRPTTGSVRLLGHLDTAEVFRDYGGYVPQAEAVHEGLTTWEVLHHAARLRLPPGTPEAELRLLVRKTLETLGLEHRATLMAGRLSGGQKRRLSIGVELVARPSVLMLDEPSSGLDPQADLALMETLRDLCKAGATVLLTTHVLENIHLFDEIHLLGSGRILYSGRPDQVFEHFQVQTWREVYQEIEEGELAAVETALVEVQSDHETPELVPPSQKGLSRWCKDFALTVERQYRLACADWRNPVLLALQPLAIGMLVGWASTSWPLVLFFCGIATLWLGCNNAAEELVGERVIFQREKLSGLGVSNYFLAKMLWLTGLTTVQGLSMLLAARLAYGEPGGALPWQVLAMFWAGALGSGLGLAISGVARDRRQAILAVPLVLIPQILLSGYVIPAFEMSSAVRTVAGGLPSFGVQRLLDVSLLWGEPLARDVLSDYWTAFRNVNERNQFHTGMVFEEWSIPLQACLQQAYWLVLLCAVAWISLWKVSRPR